MRYVVAVSGGVDSVVLLDRLVKAGEHELIVAHFDHGIRPESDTDARFVEALASRYGLDYVTRRAELGPDASEEVARHERYAFLKETAAKAGAVVVTAHHRDDVTETIAINLTRGTGWRGLDVMADATMLRPLLSESKRSLYEYAVVHDLEWVEDETNGSDAYLRNRIRRKLARLPVDQRDKVLKLRQRQRELAAAIDDEAGRLVTANRYFMTMIDDESASELLRAWLVQLGLSLTRPQRTRLLHAIKTARPGSEYEAGSGVTIRFTRMEFIVKHPL